MDQLSISVLISQVINFAVLMFVFKKFLGAKIIAEIENRKATIAKIEASDKEAENKLAEAQKEAQKIVDEARIKSGTMISDAEELAKTKSKNILDKADAEAKLKEENALRNIEKEKLEMLSGIKEKVTGLALKLNEKLFWEAKINSDFVAKEIETIKL